jgi:hypothetical protein
VLLCALQLPRVKPLILKARKIVGTLKNSVNLNATFLREQERQKHEEKLELVEDLGEEQAEEEKDGGDEGDEDALLLLEKYIPEDNGTWFRSLRLITDVITRCGSWLCVSACSFSLH